MTCFRNDSIGNPITSFILVLFLLTFWPCVFSQSVKLRYMRFELELSSFNLSPEATPVKHFLENPYPMGRLSSVFVPTAVGNQTLTLRNSVFMGLWSLRPEERT